MKTFSNFFTLVCGLILSSSVLLADQDFLDFVSDKNFVPPTSFRLSVPDLANTSHLGHFGQNAVFFEADVEIKDLKGFDHVMLVTQATDMFSEFRFKEKATEPVFIIAQKSETLYFYGPEGFLIGSVLRYENQDISKILGKNLASFNVWERTKRFSGHVTSQALLAGSAIVFFSSKAPEFDYSELLEIPILILPVLLAQFVEFAYGLTEPKIRRQALIRGQVNIDIAIREFKNRFALATFGVLPKAASNGGSYKQPKTSSDLFKFLKHIPNFTVSCSKAMKK